MEPGVVVSKPPNNFVPTKLSPSPQPISGLRPTALFPPLAKLCILPGVPFSCYCPHFLLHLSYTCPPAPPCSVGGRVLERKTLLFILPTPSSYAHL